ncbi:MAG: glutamate--tRNA ligase [Phycisphaerales bacterium]|nr:glutamate--tRNA ligase [Phycisphaerales bacterium]
MSNQTAGGSIDCVTRFAPSPTGHLHIGGARSALFCWAYAKRMGGRFMLRIEDTDAARSSDESARGIMEDLAWLGIEWDDGPSLTTRGGRVIGAGARDVGGYFQARRVPIYNRFIEQLVKNGRAYPAFESNEEIEGQRKAAVAAKQTYRYPRPSEIEFGVFNAGLEARWARASAGEPHVIRFAAPREEIVVPDQVLGDVKIAAGELDDFVIRKADGFPTYHFAVVIDDQTMGVTHVMRAQEHLANTPRHVALQRALRDEKTGEAFRTPSYAHMPLIFNMDGSKMSKRDKAKFARKAAKDAIAKDAAAKGRIVGGTGLPEKTITDFLAAETDAVEIAEKVGRFMNLTLPEVEVHDFRANGYIPEAIVNFLALLGWNPGMKMADGKDLEKFDMKFIAEHFSIERIGRTNAKFDRAKLLSFNGDAIGAMSDAEFAGRWRAWCEEFEPEFAKSVPPSGWETLGRAVKARAKTLRDGVKASAFLMLDDNSYPFDQAAVAKNLTASDGAGLKMVRMVRDRLADVEPFEAGIIHSILEQLAQQSGGMGAVAQPIRVALTGSAVSPPLGETLAVLGKARTLARLDRCLRTMSV